MYDCYLRYRCISNNCSDLCIKKTKIDYLYDKAQLSKKQRVHKGLRYDSDGTDRDVFIYLSNIQKNIVNFVSNGSNLFLHSRITGNGKTEWAIRLAQEYIESIWYKADFKPYVIFINVPHFLLALKNSIGKEDEYVEYIKSNVFSVPLVIFDEIGVRSLSEFDHEHLLNFVNARLDSGLSNIYTSNLCSDELKEKIGARLYSRIVNASSNVEFNGKDKRCLVNGSSSIS